MDWSQVLTQHQEGKNFRERQDRAQLNVPFSLKIQNGQLQLPDGIVGAEFFEEKLKEWTEPVQPIHNFDQLPIPFRAVATRLGTGERVILKEGSLAQAIRASMSVPGLFPPTKLSNTILLDGGLIENLPVRTAREMGAQIVIAVNVGTQVAAEEEVVSFVDVTMQTIQILTETNVKEQLNSLNSTDILISPDLKKYQFLDFVKVAAIIQQGESLALPAVQSLALSKDAFEQLEQQRLGKIAMATTEATKNSTSQPDSVASSLPNRVGRDQTIRFGIALGTDLNKSYVRIHAAHELKFEDPRFKWLNTIEIGQQQQLTSALVYSSKPNTGWFFSPNIDLNHRLYPIYASNIKVGDLELQRAQLRFDLGYVKNRSTEFRAGLFLDRISGGVDSRGFFDFTNSRIIPVETERATIVGSRLRLVSDTLNKPLLPTDGYRAIVEAQVGKAIAGPVDAFSFATVEVTKAEQFGQNVFELYASANGYIKSGRFSPTQFSMGGFQRLSGFDQDRFVGRDLAFARIIWRRSISGNNVFGYKEYVGSSLEIGKINKPLLFASAQDTDIKLAGSLFWAIETPVGPIFAAIGFPRGERARLYLFLGRS